MCNSHSYTEIKSAFGGIDAIIEAIFKGIIKSGDVDKGLYMATGSKLYDGVEKGFGQSLSDLDYDTPDAKMLMALRENVYVFSGFKTYQELRTISDLLIGPDGKVREKSEFMKLALDAHQDYDVRFLSAEYDNCIVSAQAASQWQTIEKDKATLPQLRYNAILDNHTTSLCRHLDGIVKPVDDPFWDRYMVPNHWGERATVDQVDGEKNTDLSKIALPDLQPVFRNNVGKTGIIFPESHPYFSVSKADKKAARNNFGLKIPTRDKPKP